MKIGSWAAYRAAAPPETFGEPDDEPAPAPTGRCIPTWPDGWAVEWFAPVRCVDIMTGQAETIEAPAGRYFARDRHGDPEAAARRWAAAMAKRHRWASLIEYWGDEVFEVIVKEARP
jgi:hypothetical protein